MNLNSLSYKYSRKDVLYDLSSFLVDFEEQEKIVDVDKKKYDYIDSAYYLGKNKLFSVFEVHHHHASDARVGLTKQAVEIMKSRSEFTQRAIFFFVPKKSNTFRISLVTFDWANNKPNNPRRYSFLVGENQKVYTAIKQLSNAVTTEEDLLKRFSIEVVNDEFYKKISWHFENLLEQIKYPKVCQQEKQEEAKGNFAVRLIGRLIFCWFLKKKHRFDGSSLIPEKLLSSKAVLECQTNYYHEVLEPLFFETLNRPIENRIEKCKKGLFQNIPFLNGGLFEAHEPEDGYKYDEKTGICYLGMAISIPNDWFGKFFETLETYNFTIDENTSTDIDLAVDPEMLGRIFENLLASINPETKESVRKTTGSYYTPREIVDYMVTQSLKQYLYTKTDVAHTIIDSLFEFEPQVEEDKLPLTKKQEIYTALEKIKVLDPAVGSGAFPMGVLQKIMSIIRVIDPTGDIYRSLPTSNTNIDKNLTPKALDYANKLTFIQKCIYGVDIQTMAIEICRLRFFLTLIVEEESDNPQPLPNLNFNFACANTLIPLDNNNVLEIKQNIQSKTEEIEKKSSHLLKGKNIWDFTKEEQEELKIIGKEIEKLKKERTLLKKQLEKANVNSFLNGEDYIAQLRAYRKDFFASSGQRKEILKKKFTDTQDKMLRALQANDWGNDKVLKLQTWRPFDNVSTGWFDPSWMFDVEDGFDLVIANPPYISTKDVSEEDKKIYKSTFGFSDDTYNLFTFKGMSLTKRKGSLTYIIPKTFWTTQTKRNMRDLLLNKKINYIFDTANPFQTVMVDTCIIQVSNELPEENHKIIFLDGSKNLQKPIYYSPIEQRVYSNTQNAVIFKPTELNLKIWERYGEKIKELYNTWWEKISTSKKIAQNSIELEKYRKRLKPGDITLLGCVTEGGQGLATANNGKYIAVRKSSKWAKNIYISRPKKLADAIKKYPQIEKEIGGLTPEEFVTTKSEKEIVAIFDSLKQKYGRDIFGQGYIYRLIDDSEIADVGDLSQDEKENGIDVEKKIYVPYDKGDKDGNRWYLETPFAIAWSKENVQFLKTDPKARYQGYSFFFKEGFCWNNILNPNARLLKCKLKLPTVNDVGSMSLTSTLEYVSNFYFVTILNSNIIFDYYREFINCTVNIQINDIRQLPIIIPTNEQLALCKMLFDKIISQKHLFDSNADISKIEGELDSFVCQLYSIHYSDEII